MQQGTQGTTWRAFGLVAAVTLLAALGSALPTRALAAQPRYSHMRLAIWPEYHDSRVLVVMEPRLAKSVKLPAKVSFLVPKGATVNMACEVAGSGAHSCQPKEVRPRGAFDEVTFIALSSHALFLEYYYDPPGSGAHRRFTFRYVPPGRVDSLSVEIQQPRNSANFVTSPPPDARAANGRGLSYRLYRRRNVAAGKPVPFTIAYIKTRAGASAPQPQNQSVAAVAGPITPEGSRIGWVLGMLGIAGLLGTLAYWMLFAPAGSVQAGAGGQAVDVADRRDPKAGIGATEPEALLCSNCGGQVHRSEESCPGCGASQKLVCSDCGAVCDRDSHLCPDCGSELTLYTT